MSETKPVTEPRESKPVDAGAARARATPEAPPRKPPETAPEAENAVRALGDVTRRVVEQGQAAVQLGLGAMTGAQAPMAESGYLQGRRAIEIAAHITSCYREAAERTSDDVQALAASSAQLARGMQQCQHVWFDMMQRTFERLGHRPQALIHSNSIAEMAQIQRDIYLEIMNSMVTASAALLQQTAQTAQDAMRPLQQRTQRGS